MARDQVESDWGNTAAFFGISFRHQDEQKQSVLIYGSFILGNTCIKRSLLYPRVREKKPSKSQSLLVEMKNRPFIVRLIFFLFTCANSMPLDQEIRNC